MLELEYLEKVKYHIWHEHTRTYEFVVAKAEECIKDPSKIHENESFERYVRDYKLYKEFLDELKEIENYISKRLKECEQERETVLNAFRLLGILKEDSS